MTDKSTDYRYKIAAALYETRDIADFRNKITEKVQLLGFSDFDVEQITESYGEVEFSLSTLPSSIINTYITEEMHLHDMLLDYLIMYDKPIYQSSIDDDLSDNKFTYERNQYNGRIRELMESHGFIDSFCIPFPLLGSDSGKSVFSVLSKDKSIADFKHKVQKNHYDLKVLVEVVHSVGRHKYPDYFQAGNTRNGAYLLSEMQLKILTSFAKYDNTASEVASRVGLSTKTVNYHIGKIKETLGAISIANAVYLAMEKGIIPRDKNIS